MLSSLHISNFKALHSLQLKNLKKINVFIGPNSSGKSSILQSVALLAQSVGSEINYEGKMVDLGSFKNTVFGHITKRKIGINLSYSISDESRDILILSRKRGEQPLFFSGNVGFGVEIDANGIIKHELKYPDLEIECVFRRVTVDQTRGMEEEIFLNRERVTRARATNEASLTVFVK